MRLQGSPSYSSETGALLLSQGDLNGMGAIPDGQILGSLQSETRLSPQVKNGVYSYQGEATSKKVGQNGSTHHGYGLSSGDMQPLSSLDSVELMASPDLRDEYASKTAIAVAHARRSSYSTARESMVSAGSTVIGSSGGSSHASSASSSLAPSRTASRPSSGYTSHAISAHSSRTSSPVSRKTDSGDEVRRGTDVNLVSRNDQLQSSPQYVETVHFASAQHPKVDGTVMSYADLKVPLSRSSSEESLQETVVRRGLPRPAHFTFSESDIVRSLRKAAEKEKARNEREAERAREQAARVAMEQEYERRRARVRETAARELAKQQHALRYRPGTVGHELSPEPVALQPKPVRPVPAHFRWNDRDLVKSNSKPENRQQIGHWTTFPKSSIVMPTGVELRAALVARLAAARREAAESSSASSSQHSSPVSRVRSSEPVLQHQQRRQSLPAAHMLESSPLGQMQPQQQHQQQQPVVMMKPSVPVGSAPRGHTRSATLASFTRAEQALLADRMAKATLANSTESVPTKTQTFRSQSDATLNSARRTQHKMLPAVTNGHIVKSNGAARVSAAVEIGSGRRAVASRVGSAPNGVTSSRSNVNWTQQRPPSQEQPQQYRAPARTASPNLGYANTVSQQRSSSASQTPKQRGSQGAGRRVPSAAGSPYAPGGESKSSSAHTSPMMPSHSLQWPDNNYERMMAHELYLAGGVLPAPAVGAAVAYPVRNPHYKDVSINPYGQRSATPARLY